MTIATIKKVNEAIAKHGVELIKSYDYFHFSGLAGDDRFNEDKIESVFSRSIKDMTVEGWVGHVEKCIADYDELH